MKKLKHILFNLIVVIIILGVIEIISAVVLNNVYNRDFDSSLIVEHKYSFSSGLKENAKGMVWGKMFHTDEQGGRVTNSRSPKKKTCLYIGDSVTEGVGVDDSSTFCYKMAQEPKEQIVRNISLIGYSTADYVNVLEHQILQDSSLSKVVICFCLNDVYSHAKTSELPVMQKHNIAGKLNALFQQNYHTYKLLKLLVFQNANRYFKYDLQFYQKNDALFNEAMHDLYFCDSACRAANISFTVLMLPYRSQLSGNDPGNRIPQNSVKNFCLTQKIGFADCTDHLAEITDPSSLYLFADEIHFSAKGHAAIADFLRDLK